MPKRGKRHKQLPPVDPSDEMLSRMALTAEQYKVIQRHCTTPAPCVLCGTYPSTYQALFMVEPHRSELWGGTRGKFRVIGYALCAPCYELPNLVLRVEAQLAAAYAGRRN